MKNTCKYVFFFVLKRAIFDKDSLEFVLLSLFAIKQI